MVRNAVPTPEVDMLAELMTVLHPVLPPEAIRRATDAAWRDVQGLQVPWLRLVLAASLARTELARAAAARLTPGSGGALVPACV